MSTARTALVTGANRGIGYEVARRLAETGLNVLLGARDLDRGHVAAAAIGRTGHSVRAVGLDVADAASVRRLVDRLAAEGTAVDVLVNNAGVYPTHPLFAIPDDVFEETLRVTLLGAYRLCRDLIPGMVERGWGRVVNVSSGAGAVTDNVPSPPAYGVAKAALNALTIALAAAVPSTVKVNAVCPGWVRTDMGGPGAPLSPAQGADTVVWAALLPPSGPSGGFFRDRKRIPW
ncbi:SDR family NAD(P)-dependent oxidoreductase [Actinokineospora sp. NPDC004072]